MSKIIFITGGARSGKSSFAEKLAKQNGKRLVYIATGEPKDEEMLKRIKKHKQRRKGELCSWKTIEEPVYLVKTLSNIKTKVDTALLDCITLWINNLIELGIKDREIMNEAKKLISVINKNKFKTIVVSNDVGAGIVPINPLARRYRDLLGTINQLVAKKADIVYQMFSGIPIKLKGDKNEIN